MIHNGPIVSSTVEVNLEDKSSVNKAEMLRPDNINNKTFQMKITLKNLKIKYCYFWNDTFQRESNH